ncbi:MAG: hypothetical protein HOB18_00140 [Nitrospina sp.]|jgi:hypothetical protein|nr:hypothetical protein [Nitrospina sp.]
MTQQRKSIKHKTPVKAMRDKCIECMGGKDSEDYRRRIKECVSVDCPIFAFRFGKDPHRHPNLSNDQRKRMANRMDKVNLARRIVGKIGANSNDIDATDT